MDPDLAFFTLIIFALLLLVLGKFAWGPIRDALDNREQSIAEQIAEAQRSHDEARRLLGEHEAKLAKAQEEIRGLMDDARKEAEVQKQSIMAEAEKRLPLSRLERSGKSTPPKTRPSRNSRNRKSIAWWIWPGASSARN